MPRISIIVPVYKTECYLMRCVDSILSQCFSDFDLILVDDGSPDKCGSICEKYAVLDKRVHVIHQKNNGVSAARNAGIDWTFENSDSEWITFIDSDDWVHPQYLECLYDAAIQKNTRISSCVYRRISNYVDVEKSVMPNIGTFDTESFFISDSCNATTAWGKLYKKQLFQNIRYPVDRLHEDEYTTYRLLFTQDRIAVIHEELYYYYVNPESITGQSWNPKRLDAIEAMDEQLKFFAESKRWNVLQARVRDYIVILMTQLNQVKSDPNRADAEKRKYEKILKKKLRFLLIKYRKYVKSTFQQDLWIYETVFPTEMKFYWYLKAFLRKISH